MATSVRPKKTNPSVDVLGATSQPLPPASALVWSQLANRNPSSSGGIGGLAGSLGAPTRLDERAMVRESIRENAAVTVPFLVMNTLAAIVVCYGLLEDSAAVVFGAMVVAMLLGPISGIALALVDGDARLLRKALIGELAGSLTTFGVSFLIGLMHRDIPTSHEILTRTTPGLLELMIALAGGAAAAYATVSPRLTGAGLVGVVIAVALVPPLATCGLCLGRQEPTLAWGAFLLSFTNLVAIQFASAVVMWLSGFHDATGGGGAEARKRRERLRATNAVSLGVLVLLTFVMATNFIRSVDEQGFETGVRQKLTRALSDYPGVHLTDLTFTRAKDSESVVALVRSPYSFTPSRVRAIEARLPARRGQRIKLEILSIIVKGTTGDGYLHLRAATAARAAGAGASVSPRPLTPTAGQLRPSIKRSAH